MTHNSEDENENKDGFCMACVAAPVALLGGGAAASSSKGKNHKRVKKWVLFISLTVSVISLLVIFWYMNKCEECR